MKSRALFAHRRRGRQGVAMIYLAVAFTATVGFVSLGVDLGRVQLAKTELQRASDAAARYAASGISSGQYVNYAKTSAAENMCDGTAVTLQTSDITAGFWDATSKTFSSTGTITNAVQIKALRTAVRGNPINTTFTSLLGRKNIDISATSVAEYIGAATTTFYAPSNGDPWLAGMPAGTTANGYDAAPANSPAQVSGLTLIPGSSLQFNFSGSASYYPGTQPFDPDGNTGWIINNYAGTEHGMAQLYAPLCATVAVFLDDNQPDTQGAAPAALDFSTATARDFATLAPKLRQPFFIGNGLREDGVTAQNFVVPAGATRMFLGIMDGQQWSDNAGGLTSYTVQPAAVIMVK